MPENSDELSPVARLLIQARGDLPRSAQAVDWNLSESTLRSYENGERIPKDSMIYLIAARTGRNPEALVKKQRMWEKANA